MQRSTRIHIVLNTTLVVSVYGMQFRAARVRLRLWNTRVKFVRITRPNHGRATRL